MGRPVILIVDHNQDDLKAMSNLLGQGGLRVITAGNAKEALQILKAEPIDVVITNFWMPDTNGLELSKSVFDSHPVVFLASEQEKIPTEESLDYCDAFLHKEQAPDRLLRATEKALMRHPFWAKRAAA